jgi:hypothetical protein
MKKKILFTIAMCIAIVATKAQTVKDTVAYPSVLLNEQVGKIDSAVYIAVNGIGIGTIRELKKDVTKLYPAEAIKAMNVWKGEGATNRFGEKAKAGAIEFILKNDGRMIKDISIVEAPDWNNKELADKIFDRVEVEAKYPGGDKQWRIFLEKTLNPNVPIDNAAPSGVYTVVVQFVVSKDGSISDIRPLTNHVYGMENEVLRVITKGPKWEAAIQNGRMVKAYRKQPVTFMVQDEEIDISTYSIKKNKNNPVEIKVFKTKDEDLEITAANGTINKLGEGMYNVRTTANERVILSIFNSKKKKQVGRVSLSVTD